MIDFISVLLAAPPSGPTPPAPKVPPTPSPSAMAGAASAAKAAGASKAAGILSKVGTFLKNAPQATAGAAWGAGAQAGAGAVSFISRQAPPMTFVFMLLFAIGIGLMGFLLNPTVEFRLLLYILYMIAFIFLFKDCFDKKEVLRLGPFFIILGVLAPTIGNSVATSFMPELVKQSILFALFLLGYAGPILMLLLVSVDENALTTGLKIGLILMIVFFIFSHFLDTGLLLNGDGVSYEQKGFIYDSLKTTWAFMKTVPAMVLNATVRGANTLNNETDKLFAQATGSYEENVDEKTQVSTLGLSFKEVTLSNTDGVYFQGDPVTAWATLESRSLDRPIDVYASCYADRDLGKNLWILGNISNPAFTVYDLDYRDVTCSFAKNVFVDKKSHKTDIFATFNYTTNSYLRRYFISQDDYTSLREANIDPKVQYKIPATDEQGKFTNGPVEVSVIKNNLLQPLDAETKFTVGYRIDVNAKAGWKNGRLLDIQHFIISMPTGFTIEKNTDGTYACSTPFVDYPQDSCIADCANTEKSERCIEDCATYLQYELNTDELTNTTEKDVTFIKTPLVITCPIEVKNAQTVLGKSPLAIKNFRATADYQFELSTEKPFRVETKEGYVNPNKITDFCGFKTAYAETNVTANLDTIGQRVSKTIEDSKYPQENVTILDGEVSGKTTFCKGLIKGIIAYENRNGPANIVGLGYVGMSTAQVESVGGNTNSSYLKESRDDIGYVTTYLLQQLEKPECAYQDSKMIDCAVEKLICEGQASTCAKTQVPIVIQLAKRYEQ